jgi:hypothetical protein
MKYINKTAKNRKMKEQAQSLGYINLETAFDGLITGGSTKQQIADMFSCSMHSVNKYLHGKHKKENS